MVMENMNQLLSIIHHHGMALNGFQRRPLNGAARTPGGTVMVIVPVSHILACH